MPVARTPKMALTGFALSLVQKHQFDEKKLCQALEKAAATKTSFIFYLTQESWVPKEKLAQAVSQYFALPLFNLDAFNTTVIPSDLLSLPFVQKRFALPLLKKENNLYLAVTDPTSTVLNDIKFITGFNLRLIIVAADKLQQCFEGIQSAQLLSGLGDLDDEELNELNISTYRDEEENALKQQLDMNMDTAPIVRYVNKILLDAINKEASDIHFEPYEDSYRIRCRQDGMLRMVASPPLHLASFIVARIKVMANLNTAERRVPQDGRFKVILSKTRSIDFRISTCPTIFGEKVVMRLLEPAQALPGVENLGMEPQQQTYFKNALAHPQGIILLSGPTGSGKTVTLYTALNILNTMQDNISTVEDPVEIPMPGINQVHVNQKTGLTFATVLRSFLRQDPDIIMVGEIRDLETAEISVKAAQTGHLVLSTVHTNSAAETILRLENIGVAPYNLASSLLLIIAQRLARHLCEHCKKSVKLTKEAALLEGFKPDEIDATSCYEAVGCDQCYDGYKGRVGIFEVLPITPTMIKLILSGATAAQLADQARAEGIMGLREAGLVKVKAGLTSLAELNRVL